MYGELHIFTEDVVASTNARWTWMIYLRLSPNRRRYDSVVNTMWIYQTKAAAKAAAHRVAERLGLDVV